MANRKTPATDGALLRFEEMKPLEAVVKAWTHPGPRPAHHAHMRRVVRDSMPLLAQSLDRLAAEQS